MHPENEADSRYKTATSRQFPHLDTGIICTRHGTAVDVTDPRPEMIVIRDIAHALAAINRFNGHTARPYSVAQHSVMVSHFVPPELAWWGLMHDAHEAYIGDVASPIKRLFPAIKSMEIALDHAIATKFGRTTIEFDSAAIKDADTYALAFERRGLMPETTWWAQADIPMQLDPENNAIRKCWRPGLAKNLFLKRFYAIGAS